MVNPVAHRITKGESTEMEILKLTSMIVSRIHLLTIHEFGD